MAKPQNHFRVLLLGRFLQKTAIFDGVSRKVGVKRVVDFDLKNVYFAVGDPKKKYNLYRQIIGVPMGSPLSPALAKITCMYFENMMLQKYKHENACYIEGVRYMDDLLAL